MPLLRFTVLTDKVRDHTKTQTIRKPRKNPLKLGDELFIYTQEKLGEGTIINIKRKKISELTEEDAQKDGFETLEECQALLMQMHDCGFDEEFDVINYLPYFHPTVVKEI